MRRIGLVILLTALAAGGCVQGARPSPPDPARVEASSSRVPPTLLAIASTTLGTIIIDKNGYVVYRFDRDVPDPPTSRCLDGCVPSWLPVLADELRVEGIDRQLVGTLRRADGTVQLTLAGWPLYGYTGDRMPGDTNGQGVDGLWFAIAPSGAKAGPTKPLP